MKNQFTTLHNESRTGQRAAPDSSNPKGERTRSGVRCLTPPPTTTKLAPGTPLGDSLASDSDRRGRQSEHAGARVLPNSNCIVPALALLMRMLLAAMLLLPAFGASASVVLTTLHSFQVSTNGANPYTGLIQASDGSFYGAAYSGGTNGGYGAIFKITTNSVLTHVYSFSGGKDGTNPNGPLVEGSDGNFYGTTLNGGINSGGTVFKVTPGGALTTLHLFTNGLDGAGPGAGLVQGSNGFLYGATLFGGGAAGGGGGIVFKITTNGVLTPLHAFSGGADGAAPNALVQGRDGDFYGTTYGGEGGSSGNGTIFRISATGAFTTLHSFTDRAGGANPYGTLIQAGDGDFYGTTVVGGNTNADGRGYGTIFKISAGGTFSQLYSFAGNSDGAYPWPGLAQAGDGNFYGATGGAYTTNSGTVFRFSSTGSTGTLATLYSFTGGNDGAYPEAGLALGRDGSFYGTTVLGGTDNLGTVFKITTNGALATLYSFPRGTDGTSPSSALFPGSDGYFYGATYSGGPSNAGAIYKIGENGVLTNLYYFTGGADGANPGPGLAQGSDGNFYGTTAAGAGTVFKMNSNGQLSTLYTFTGGADGAWPDTLVRGSDACFYGTTSDGGAHRFGTVFQLNTNGQLTTLYSFTGGADDQNPDALLLGSDGNFYGTTYGQPNAYGVNGTVFEITTHGVLATLYSFYGYANPDGALLQDSDGDLYGTTASGDGGAVFELATNGNLRLFHLNEGSSPNSLVQGSDGNFYGTSVNGLLNNSPPISGTVFELSTNGTMTTLYVFSGNDGADPIGLTQGSDGNFYGVTAFGGQCGAGTLFRMTIVPECQTVTLTNSALSLIWSTEAGGKYLLQYNSDLNSSNWSNLSGPFTATGATFSTTDSITNGPQRFYRLVLLP